MNRQHPVRPHLRAWRKAMRKTLQAVGEAMGVSHSTVKRWEEGGGMDDASFARLAAFYGVTVGELSDAPEARDRARLIGEILEAIPTLDDQRLRMLRAALPDATKKLSNER
jgi:transcriptional regulator with XRE-family HTH domain